LLPAGSMNFKPGEGVIAGTSNPHSLLSSCERCLAVGQFGQQGQPGVEVTVPEGSNRLEFVAGLTDSSTETDQSAYISVWTEINDELTNLFESGDVTVGVVTPVSASVMPGDGVRIDGGHLNGNETLVSAMPSWSKSHNSSA
jgi:hypothetical protein